MSEMTPEQMAKALKKAAEELKKATEAGLTGVVLLAEKFAKEEAPVDTGALRSEIHNTPVKRTAQGFKGEVRSGDNILYAMFVHDGTRRARANPYMARAAQRTEGKAARIVTTELKRVL